MKGKGFGLVIFVVALVVSLVSVSPAVGADKPVWRILWAVLPEVDYTHSTGERIAITMTSKDLEVCERMAKRTEIFMEEAAKGAVDFEVVAKVSNQVVTTLSDSGLNGIWLAPSDLPTDIQNEINSYMQTNNAYQLIVGTIRLEEEEYNPLTSYYGGLTVSQYSYVKLFPGYHYEWYDESSPANPYPELEWIHELLHGIVNHYSAKGYSMPDIHYPENYGFPGLNGLGAEGNEEFYRAFLSGNLYDSAGRQVGITPDMWQLKSNSTPTNPTTPTSPSPTPTSKDGGGGGCDTSLAGISLLAVVALFGRKQS